MVSIVAHLATLNDSVPQRKTPVDVWRMIGSMRAVGELVRCIDGSWMTRPHHARNGGADASVPRSRHESHRIVPPVQLPGARERVVFERNHTAVPASGRESMT
jgi:hypothetical protein